MSGFCSLNSSGHKPKESITRNYMKIGNTDDRSDDSDPDFDPGYLCELALSQ